MVNAKPASTWPTPNIRGYTVEDQWRQRRRRGLRDPADDDVPRAAREVVEHHDRERPERDREPEEPADQPGAEERGRAERAADGGDAERDDADRERAPLEPEEG